MNTVNKKEIQDSAQELIPTPFLASILKEVEADIKTKRNITTVNTDQELMNRLDSLE